MAVLRKPLSVFAFTGANLSHTALAEDERASWAPPDERPSRALTPLVVALHRLRKFFAGAYRWRDVTIDIYTKEQPHRRQNISASVGFRWPKTPTS